MNTESLAWLLIRHQSSLPNECAHLGGCYHRLRRASSVHSCGILAPRQQELPYLGERGRRQRQKGFEVHRRVHTAPTSFSLVVFHDRQGMLPAELSLERLLMTA